MKVSKINFFHYLGKYIMFMSKVLSKPDKWKMFRRKLIYEMEAIGIGSLGIVVIISLFIGAVTTVNTAYQLESPMFDISIIGAIVADSTILEFAPTITSLILAGKVGSHIASEIGTMRISEEIDAMDIMGINSQNFIALPKIIAGLLMIPCLIVFAIILGIFGGMVVGEMSGILSNEKFIEGAQSVFRPKTLWFSITKAYVFAFIITSVASFHGYITKGGSIEVGKSSTNAVVYSSILILLSDYLLAALIL